MSKERRKVEWSLDLEHMKARAGQFVSEAMGGAAETKTASLSESLEGASSAKIEIAFPVGQASIGALEAQSPNLFEAELTYIGEYEFDVNGGAERVIRLRQKSGMADDLGAMVGNARDLRWDIALARNLPMQLSVAAGVGEANMDLSGLRIDALRLATGVGKVALTLPARQRVAAEVRGGVGLTEVKIPSGAYGALDIMGGLGGVDITVSQSTAARVEAKAGMGTINVPESFIRVSGEKNAKSVRVWQSADYADADQKTIIRYTGGVGRFRLETVD